MTAIVTLTLNPALDLSTSVPRVVAGPKLRCALPRIEPGGGGVNVARMINRLGGDCTAVVVAGGPTGEMLLDLLAAEGVPARAIRVSGATRQSLAVTEEAGGGQFRFVLPGAAPAEADVAAVEAALPGMIPRNGHAVLSGSLPQGWPLATLDRLKEGCAERGARLVADTSGAALDHLLRGTDGRLSLLRLDADELASAVPGLDGSVAASARAAREMVARGVARAVVAGCRAEGTLYVSAEAALFCAPPKVEVVSSVGAGDALLGAMVWRLASGDGPAEALRWGVAVAAATVTTPGTELCTRAEAEALLPGCVLRDF